MFTLFVSVGVALVLFYVICVCKGSSFLIYVICVCRRAQVVFTLFVSVGVAFVLFYVICVCKGSSCPVLFTLFVFVEELLSYLRYLCL